MIVGIAMVRDELDIIGRIIAHLLDEGVDHLIVADNMSTDGTREIVEDWARFAPDSVTLIDDLEKGYYQDRKMTNLAHQAGAMGASWVIPFDADEWWYSPKGRLKDVIEATDADVLTAATFAHVPQPDDSTSPDPIRRITHRMADPKGLPKVAFRYHPECRLHMGNHDVELPSKSIEQGVLEIREFQYRSFEQMKRKVRNGKQAYDATNLADTYGAHWRRLGAMTDDELRAEWDAHCGTEGLVYDPVGSGLPRLTPGALHATG